MGHAQGRAGGSPITISWLLYIHIAVEFNAKPIISDYFFHGRDGGKGNVIP